MNFLTNLFGKKNWALQALVDRDPALALEALRAGASLEAKDRNGNFPLHYAAAFGYLDVIEEIVKLGGRLDAKNRVGQTPLVYAMLEGQPAAARALWAHQAKQFASTGTAEPLLELCGIGVDWSFLPGEASSGFFLKGSPLANNIHPRARQIGEEIHRLGGIAAMRAAHAFVHQELGHNAASNLSCVWNRVGDWLD